MISALLLLITTLFFECTFAQYTPQTYPDPRTDPISCRTLLPGQVCDPSEILTADERRLLNEKILTLQRVTTNIKNMAPECANAQSTNLYIMVALMDRLGTPPYESVDIEKFTNFLRSKFLNFQDVSLCDTMVLIVNSRTDRQVFTVAGRDAKLSREVLQTAFHRNVGHFRSGNYALGLHGMIEYIVSAYGSAHIVQVPSPTTADGADSGALLGSTNSAGSGQFVATAQGVRQQSKMAERFNIESVPEDDRIWVQILLKASSLCGYDTKMMARNVRAVVEEAMSLSLKLISDPRYNKIEEDAQDFAAGTNARDKAWESAKSAFIDALYEKYGHRFPRRANQCPELEEAGDSSSSISRLLRA